MVKHKLKKSIPDPRQSQAEPIELKLEDDEGESLRRHGPRTNLKGGYNPYDRDLLKKPRPEARHQTTDLRKLSEWIRLKREVEELKQQDAAAAAEKPKGK